MRVSACAQNNGDLPAILEEQSKAAADVERLGGWDTMHNVDAMLGHVGVRRPMLP